MLAMAVTSVLLCCSFSNPVTMASENQTVSSDNLTFVSTSSPPKDNQNANNAFADIDKLLEGDDENKTKAYTMIEEMLQKVSWHFI